MTAEVQELIESFNRLSEADKKVIVVEVLRQTTYSETPSISDEELVLNAEELFLEIDMRENEDAKPDSQ